MIKSTYQPYTLVFKFDAGTSRGVLKEKKTWFVAIRNAAGATGIGECGPLKGLSIDDREDFEIHLANTCRQFEKIDVPSSEGEVLKVVEELIPKNFPSIRFGFESALLDLLNNGNRVIFNNTFLNGQLIPINGLVWMGSKEFMLEQIDKKIAEGYRCIKIKIGAIEFEKECEVLGYIRSKFDESELIIRVDANGAFDFDEAKIKMNRLADYQIHSIEQPIKSGQWEAMKKLVMEEIIPVALDEELIGVHSREEKSRLLDTIMPPFIILKPTLHGGIRSTMEWIELAEERRIGWWITSALESNIGLNAIAQLTAQHPVILPQGLGTGQLYTNNIDSPLEIENGYLKYNPNKPFNTASIGFQFK